MITRIAALIGLLCIVSQANAFNNVMKCKAEDPKDQEEIGMLTLDLDRQILKSPKFTFGMGGGETIGLQQLKKQHGVTAYRATLEDNILTFYIPENVPPDSRDSTQFQIRLKWWSDGDGDHLIQNFTLICQNVP